MPQADVSHLSAISDTLASATAGRVRSTALQNVELSRTAKRLILQLRSAVRPALRFLEQQVWDARPLTEEKAVRILSTWDCDVIVHRRCPSETHQVFQITWHGRPCVAKFAGRPFANKFVLHDEAARLRKLAVLGLPVPTVLLAETNRWRHPFFIMPDLELKPRSTWSNSVRRAAWDQEAEIIATLQRGTICAQLAAKQEVESVRALQREIADLRLAVVQAGLPTEPYLGILDEFARIIRSRPWIIGQYQPPEIVYDGHRFWAVDWDSVSYSHPLKWANDYSFYDFIRDPEIGERHLTFLLRTLGFDPADPSARRELRLWQQFKAISVGTYVILKDRRWEYFAVLKQRFFDSPSTSLAPIVSSDS